MWIFLSDSYVSIVQHRDDHELLLVRGRVAGDVARFMGVKANLEQIDESADYRFRMIARRVDVERRLVMALGRVRYPNFKDSIRAAWRKAAAMRVWSIMFNVQREREH